MSETEPQASCDQMAKVLNDVPPTLATGIGRNPLLDIEGVATWLGTSHRHVRRLVAERRIPFVKVGHYVRFDDAEVAAWIDGHRVGSDD